VHVARPTENSGVVLAATDLSDPSLPAVKAGAEEARRRGARLVVVSAIDWWGGAWTSAVGTPFGMATAMPPAELQNEVRASLDTMLRRALETFGAEGETRVLEGSAAAAIVQAAEDLGAELVIVGTRGRTGFARLALGSVAERVVRGAGCSVLVERLHDVT
jgi:nucleotide-binding universal stress UspA family protein